MADGPVTTSDRSLLDRLRPSEEDTPSLVLALLPWLGVPVLVSAALAAAGHALPGEVLPVVAFLPLVAVVAVVALLLPAGWRVWGLAVPGALLCAALLAFVADNPGPGAARTVWTALAVTAVCTAWAGALGKARAGLAGLATAAGAAMVFSQGLDGWLTYLAVGNPFGWLPVPVEERVPVSRLILEVAPLAYPVLKLALGAVVAVVVARRPAHPWSVPFALVVCYAGLSPAMFSAANLLG